MGILGANATGRKEKGRERIGQATARGVGHDGRSSAQATGTSPGPREAELEIRHLTVFRRKPEASPDRRNRLGRKLRRRVGYGLRGVRRAMRARGRPGSTCFATAW